MGAWGAGGRSGHAGLTVVLLIFGFLLGTGFAQEELREREAPERRQQLQDVVARRRATIDDLRIEVGSLSDRVRVAQERAGRRSRRVRDLLARVDEAASQAGVAAMRGPGVVVTLMDSARIPESRQEAADLHIQDDDLQLVVNALWRAGAEAVAVNGHRLVSSSAIRRAGGSILVNYAQVTSPFRVVALGDADDLAGDLTESEIARRFGVWVEVYGLGFAVDRATELEAPALPAGPEIRFARPERTGA